MNEVLFLKINSWVGVSSWLDQFMVFSAEPLGYLLISVVFIMYFKERNKNRELFFVSLISAFTGRFILVEIIRFFYNNPRPFVALENINILLNHETTSSFPSGHATFYFALAMGVYLYNKKAGYAYFALAGLISFARVFTSVHWPLDVLAGAVLGIVTTFLVYTASNQAKVRFLPPVSPS